MRRQAIGTLWVMSVLLFISPGYTLPFSFNWPTEGSYVQQLAHLLFGASMLFFIHEIYRADLQKFRGFRCLIWAWALLAIWNLDAFIGHWADWTLSNPVILGQGLAQKLLMYDFQTWLVYLTKIDHYVFLVPAFYLFYRGLKALDRNSQTEFP
jgi:hypothetical protein